MRTTPVIAVIDGCTPNIPHSPFIDYVLLLTDPDLDAPIPASPAQHGDWLAVVRNTSKTRAPMPFIDNAISVVHEASNLRVVATTSIDGLVVEGVPSLG